MNRTKLFFILIFPILCCTRVDIIKILEWISILLGFIRANYVSWLTRSTVPQVNISQGLIQGTTLETRNGRYISGFIGIPFAQPPVRELRFSSPLPAKKWDEILSANAEADMCPQFSKETIKGNENCLYLNVFTPFREFKNSVAINNSILLPVTVYIHGGGFDSGSSSPFVYGPNYLLDKDIILITFNYRLGIFGFLSTGDSVASGNFGLMDQVLALKWVQENIKSFGGNPRRVTIFGESAGGASVSLHSFSDASNGLFHQYITQSGSALCPWVYRKKNEFKSDVHETAKNLECSNENSKDLIKCLREIDTYDLLYATKFISLRMPELAGTPTDEVESEDAFSIDNPRNLIRKNKMKDYPFIIGSVANEGLYTTLPFYSNTASLPLKNVFDNLLNYMSHQYATPENEFSVHETVSAYYFNQSDMFENKEMFLQNLTDLVSDGAFYYAKLNLLDKIAKVAKSPLYFYKYGYNGQMNILELGYGTKQNLGVPHGGELPSLFTIGPMRYLSSRNEYMIDVMVDLWTSFARNSKPTSEKLNDPHLWEPYVKSKHFLHFGNVTDNKDPSVTLEGNNLTNRTQF